MTKRALILALLGASLMTTACGSYASHVEADDATLGRVVVYRNGIAYYERSAEVVDGRLTMTVPHDKVDDFLKSLTVKDALTGETLPVSFPTSGATSDGKVDMTVQMSEPGTHRVVLTYITESPAWKPSYRVMVDGDKVTLQGWAIVDNTSGEKWESVRVGVGSSSALSFRYDLRTVRNVYRETLHVDERFAVAPPTGKSTYKEDRDGQKVIASFDPTLIPTADQARESQIAMLDMDDEAVSGSIAGPESGANGRASRVTADGYTKQPAREPRRKDLMGDTQLETLAARLNQGTGEVIIEGYAAKGERNAELTAADRANWMRNRLIEKGVAPARLKVEAKGMVSGKTAGVQLVQADVPGDPAALDGDPVGESHFQSDAPVTVDKGTSAMISILDDQAEGSIVYLYDAESERGNAHFAFKSIRFLNPTESTLETGPMTVYGDGRFIGEGLSEPIPPNSTAIIPFALDRQIIVEKDHESGDKISRLMTLQRGVLRTEVAHRRVTKVKLTSRLHKETQVFLRHTLRRGWDLDKSPEIYERQGEAHLFAVTLAPGATETVEIVESTPLVKAVDVRTPTGMDMVRVYLAGEDVDERFAEPMRKLLAIHEEMANIREGIAATRDRIGEFRARTEELRQQIVSLDGVRGGTSLLRHLKSKLEDMSNRVQKGTIDIVDLKEQLMLARIKFADGVSELRLEPQVSDARPTP